MSEPVKRSHFWLFDEQQLEEALTKWMASSEHMACLASQQREEFRELLDEFLNSRICTERGMRRGGTDDS